ncbi:NrfD/PsrC family molybdoenzyme membrane anchor subunit [Sulfurovum sp.]|jgi:molybdopterin-containing oxidoreductase family membrane subunit|uniref:NrfD/PsrC family molybdoenzyme membrane anchor subunit n=1 Tax=Sulfurovum sp. TaxID=1969726 RepID=UPI002A368BBE|nr:NrfD/PsrC family molybdoenzyme membrane anchor subunit [Sulfurovum sp.]MDY0402841.1 NrfD/PsrC family molybdoenzyme membrane anchor subunit [Sulfurovum sp.]
MAEAVKKQGIKEFITSIPYNKIGLKDLVSFEKTPRNIIIAIITFAFLVSFAVGVTLYLMHGHHAYNVTREHPWGLLIAVYIFFVVSSTGLCIVGSLGDVFGFKEYEMISKRAIFGSIVTIMAGFAVIAFEIGHPVTMLIYNVLTPGFTSAIWWMGTLYGLYLTFMIIEFVFLLKHDMRMARIFGLTGLLVGLAAHSNLGGVFGFLNARTISNGVFYPTYFILTAFITGIFIAFIMMGVRYRLAFPENAKTMLTNLAKIQGLLISILIFFVTWKMLTDIYGGMPNRSEVALHILGSWTFWAEVVLAMAIPLLIILKSRGTALHAMFWASLSGMVGVFFMRYNLVHDTQLKPLQMMKVREYQLAPEWVHYFPSAAEIMISLGGVGLCILLYYVGTKLFNLDDEAH